MTNSNIKNKYLKYGKIILHIYHKEESKADLIKNNFIEKITHKKKLIFCSNGINKCLAV